MFNIINSFDLFPILAVLLIILLLQTNKSCKCEKFDQSLIDANCAQLNIDKNAINDLKNKVCNSKDTTDRDKISNATACRDTNEMTIFNDRESSNWCKNLIKKVDSTIISYPATGLILNGNYYSIDEQIIDDSQYIQNDKLYAKTLN